MAAMRTLEALEEAEPVTETLRVAIADDDSETRRTLSAMLASLGHEVAFAGSTGRELVNHCLE
ncbi:MAG: hypothetical protein ACREHD_04655, partial [Pirellulales bacterium]